MHLMLLTSWKFVYSGKKADAKPASWVQLPGKAELSCINTGSFEWATAAVCAGSVSFRESSHFIVFAILPDAFAMYLLIINSLICRQWSSATTVRW